MAVGMTRTFSPDDGLALLAIARAAIEARVHRRDDPPVPGRPPFIHRAGAFVTLRRHGALRGCVGQPEPQAPLGAVIVRCAGAAALDDPRFPPVQPEELAAIHVELSVLTPLVRSAAEEVEVGRHGVLVARGWRRGLLLPQVPVEAGWDRETFLEAACRKAGLPPDAWRTGADVFTFEAEIFSESVV
ncbi:MAG TPA: AmmeMemoRadiSam system protein A [Vicinamibacterales bacterium]